MVILDSAVGVGEVRESDPTLFIRWRPGDGAERTVCGLSLEAESLDCNRSQIHAGVGVGWEKSADEVGSGKGGGEKVGNVEDREMDSYAKFAYRPSAPAHRRIRESPLNSNAIFKQSHAGLFNLCIVVLVAVNSRLIIENLMKYGSLIGSGFFFSTSLLRHWPLLMCCLTFPIFPSAAFIIEKLVQQKYISEPVVVTLHTLITTAAIFYPVLVILRCDYAFLSGVMLMLFACIVWLKLVSYAHTNYDLRALAKGETSSDSSKEYSYNINGKSLVYFMVARTLCHQPIYPRTTCI